MTCPTFRLLLVMTLMVLPIAARGQGGVTGSIAGMVLDSRGVPLTGVRLTAQSPTHIGGTTTTYSDQQGRFRFRNLMPGEFEVTASAVGMRLVRQQGVQVGVNASAELAVVMEVSAVEEEVKVVERAPPLSRTTAQVKEVYEERFMDHLPIETRTAIEEFVGNNVPGASPVSRRTARIRGGNVEQNAFMVDGFLMNNQKTMYKTLSALEVQTAGYGADGSTVPGGLITMVTKTGSNRLEMDVSGFREDSRLRPFTDDGDPQYLFTNTFLNGNVSGPVLPDRLWYYVNLEARREYQEREPDPSGLFVDPAAYRYGNLRGTAKLTWQLTSRHRLQSFTLINRDYSHNRDANPSTAAEAQFGNADLDWFTGLTWDGLLTDNLTLRSQVGFTRFLFQQTPDRCGDDRALCQGLPAIVQTYPVPSRAQNFDTIAEQRQHGIEVVNTLEWFARPRRAVLGEHDVKLVSRYFTRSDAIVEGTPGDRILQFNGLLPDRETEFFSNDPRLEPPRHGFRIAESHGFRLTHSLQDAARVTRYLTVTPALALTVSRSGNSLGDRVTDLTALTPHLAVVWDATHDGRNILRGSLNSYVDIDVGRLARFTLGSRVSRTCRWNAASGSYDTDCVFAGGTGGATIGLPCGPTGVDNQGRSCRQALQVPRTWEYTLGAGRMLTDRVTLESDLVYRDYTRQYSTRETNRIWNSSGSALEPTGSYRDGQPRTVQDLETPAAARRKYLGITTSLHQRAGRATLNAGYTWARLVGNVHNTEVNAWGDIPPRDPLLWGYLPDDVRHSIIATGVWQWTAWMSGGIAYRFWSGRPYSRVFRNSVTGGFDDYRARVGDNPGANLNDPGDDRALRLPDIHQLNLQLRANLTSLAPALRTNLELFADVINVLGLRTPTALVEQEARFGQVLTRTAPTSVRLGFRLKY